MDKKLLENLKELQIIEAEELEKIEEESKNARTNLKELLLSKELISKENLTRIEADILNLPFVDLENISIDQEVLEIIPEIVAKKQKIIAFKKDKDGLHVAMSEPSNEEIIQFLNKKTGFEIKVHYTTEENIIDSLAHYTINTEETFNRLISKNKKAIHTLAEPPIEELVNTIIDNGYKNKASDIHIEPLENKSLIRFRIDGILHDIVELPKELHQQIIIRIKVMADLQTDEHLKPQDGKITFDTDLEELDLRVSIVPVTGGEKVVMRLLSERSRKFSLHDLGFAQKDFEKVHEAYIKPHGMILVTGPTGSGKTTTLYAIIKLLNQRDVNITTIEDPVEYDIEGINQIQTNQQTGLTFAKGLRSLVRQDPDIILIGEIRDQETAGIAINSAMTGHLVLSSLHTNDAATAIPRFMDLQIEPFLIASTINIVIAQRLVRKICTNCRVSENIKVSKLNEDLKKHFPDTEEVRLYHGEGCEICHDSGYKGRIGIFEVMIMNDSLRDAITEKKNAEEIEKTAIKSGMTTMTEDGIKKVRSGVTTLEEVVRVTKI